MGKNHVQHQPFQAVYALCRQSETGYDIERERWREGYGKEMLWCQHGEVNCVRHSKDNKWLLNQYSYSIWNYKLRTHS